MGFIATINLFTFSSMINYEQIEYYHVELVGPEDVVEPNNVEDDGEDDVVEEDIEEDEAEETANAYEELDLVKPSSLYGLHVCNSVFCIICGISFIFHALCCRLRMMKFLYNQTHVSFCLFILFNHVFNTKI